MIGRTNGHKMNKRAVRMPTRSFSRYEMLQPCSCSRCACAEPQMPPPMTLFDSHVHLDAHEFDIDRNDVLAAAREAGVREMLVPAITASDWAAVRDLCAGGAGLYPAYGLHPLYLPRHSDDDLHLLRTWLQQHPAAALGECGLDFHDPALDRERQLHLLRGQLRLACEFDRPLVLHARGAFEEEIGRASCRE